MLFRTENIYNSIKNSTLRQLLFQPWYLHVASGIETVLIPVILTKQAILILSIVGSPLIGLSLLPITTNLANNKLARGIVFFPYSTSS